MNLIAATLTALILIEPIPPHPLEQWPERWELLPMPPREPQYASGSLQHSSGIPAYGAGDDLTTGTSTTNFCGDTSVAVDFFTGGNLLAMYGDSQLVGGTARFLRSLTRILPLSAQDWSHIPYTYGVGDPHYLTRSTPAQHYFSSGWHRLNSTTTTNFAATNALATIGDIWTDNGFADPEEMGIPFAWINEENDASLISVAVSSGNDQGEVWYDEDTIGNNSDGVGIQVHMPIIHGGGTSIGSLTDFKIFASYYDPSGSIQSDETTFTLPTGGTGSHTFGSGNNSAVISMVESDVWINGSSAVSWRPTFPLREDGSTNADAANIIAPQGFLQFFESDGVTPRGVFGITIGDGMSGRNPEGRMPPGADNGSSNLIMHGGEAAFRYWRLTNYGNPNVFVYSYGHNATTRDITTEQANAESVFQADLFDIIHQDITDYGYLNAGAKPKIVIIFPWAAGSYMDQDRHDEMVGVVNALNELGYSTLGIDLFNYWGGESFVDSAAPSDWTVATSFALDGAVHPNSMQDARAAWYPFYTIMQEAAAAHTTTRNRTRSRSR